MLVLLPVKDGIGRFVLPHVSGEEVRASLSSIERVIPLSVSASV